VTPGCVLRSGVMRFAASRGRRRAIHLAAELRRRIGRAPHRIEYFHHVGDPYSHLAAQLLRPLQDTYAVEIGVHLVGASDGSFAPERSRLEAWARRDAADVAPHYGLCFPAAPAQPDAQAVGLAERILAACRDTETFAERAPVVGEALWSVAHARLDALAAEWDTLDVARARATVAAGSERRRRLGHYAGAMFRYGGEWYWGVDRLVHLETRLAARGAVRGPRARIAPRPRIELPDDRAPTREITVEIYLSLRSPYTAIVLRRAVTWAHMAGVRLVLRPVLPMVMRDVPVPWRKALYIQMDAAREASLAGVPFGWIVDPLGAPVERGLALFRWARDRGSVERLMLSFLEGAFCHGIDVTRDGGMERVVERAGLPWEEARQVVRSEGWRKEVEENRQALYALGLWGVPSFRVRGPAGSEDFSAWGQDRLWRVAHEVHQRAGGA